MTRLLCIVLLLFILTCSVQSITPRRIRRDEKLTRKPQRESEGHDWIPAPRHGPPSAPWKSIDLSPKPKQSNTNEQTSDLSDSNELVSRNAIHQLQLSQSQATDSQNDDQIFDTNLDEDEKEFARELRNKIIQSSTSLPISSSTTSENKIDEISKPVSSDIVIDTSKSSELPLVEAVSDDSTKPSDVETRQSNQAVDIVTEPVPAVSESVSNETPSVDLPVIERVTTNENENVNPKSDESDAASIDKPIVESNEPISNVDSNPNVAKPVDDVASQQIETKTIITDTPPADDVRPNDETKQFEAPIVAEPISNEQTRNSEEISDTPVTSNLDSENDVARDLEGETNQTNESSNSFHSMFILFLLLVVCYVCWTRRYQIKNMLSRASQNATSRLKEGATNKQQINEMKPLMETARDDDDETRAESPKKPNVKPAAAPIVKNVSSRLGAVALVDTSKDASIKPNKALDDEDAWNDFDAWDD